MDNDLRIGAVILGAGLSTRMGTPKLQLPWGHSTVIGSIIKTLRSANIQKIFLVSGSIHQLLVDQLNQEEVTIAFNPKFENENMMDSLRVGLKSLREGNLNFCLLALGDQPQIEGNVIHAVTDEAFRHPDSLIIPSYQMRRGHPWVIPERFWDYIQGESDDHTMRDFINLHQEYIHYVNVNSPSILADMDTPQDYEREKPEDNRKQV